MPNMLGNSEKKKGPYPVRRGRQKGSTLRNEVTFELSLQEQVRFQ